MKQFTRWFLFLFTLFVTAVSVACTTDELIEYHLDQSEFNSVVIFGDEVDLNGLVVKASIGTEVTSIPVTSEMVTRCDSTLSVGEKSLTISYESFSADVLFTVMYKVEFVIGENTETQYVLSADEIVEPTETALAGYEFIGWTPEIPSVINGNMTFVATYTDVPLDVPKLGNYTSTYSDTLATITLPSNSSGAWAFVDPLDTPVGNVGTNTFEVEFIPTNTALQKISGVVNITVNKKKLEFKNIVTSFVYDGEEHIPTYELDVEGLTVNYGGQRAEEVGNNYFYAFNIDDENYYGTATGYFSITKCVVEVNFTEEVYTINFRDPLPNATYEVVGIEDPSVLDIKVVYPNVTQAGEYTIELEVGLNDTSNYKITLDTAKLVVLKVSSQDSEVDIDPETKAIYLNTLSTLNILDTNPYGWWVWENPDYVFDAAGEATVVAIFTPYDSTSYEAYSKEVTIEVLKRTATINVVNSTFDYDGQDKTIAYEIVGGPSDLVVEGNVVGTNAGRYLTSLTINDANYEGTVSVTLVINQVQDPTMDFSTIYDLYVDDTLSMIELPNGYVWDNSTIKLAYTGETQYYKATYTPEDIINYLVVKGEFGVNVKKYAATVTANDEYEFTYNGQAFTLTGITPSHYYSNIEFTYEKNGEVYQSLTNAGIYNVTITLPATEKYNEASKTVVVTIKQSTDFTKPLGYEAIYGQTLGDIELPITTGYGEWTWKTGDDTLVGNTGDNYHVAIFTSTNDNYANDEVTVKVTVSKKQLVITVLESEFTYDGTTKNVIYEVNGFVNGDDLSNITVAGNEGAIKYGTYPVNLVINADNYSGSSSTRLVIKKATPTTDFSTVYTAKWSQNLTLADIKLPNGYTWVDSSIVINNIESNAYAATYTPDDTYNYVSVSGEFVVNVVQADSMINVNLNQTFTYGSVIDLGATANHSESTLEYKYFKDGIEIFEINGVGTYKVEITLAESTHYNAADKQIVTVVVTAKAVSTVWNYASNYVYNVNGQVLPTATFIDINGIVQTVTVTEIDGKEFINHGTYNFVATTLDENYVLVNETLSNIVIAKATFNMNNVMWSYTGNFIYNGSERTVVLRGLPTGVTAEYAGNKATNVGNYTATVTFEYDTANYNEIAPIAAREWSIVASAVSVVWTYDAIYTYTGSNLTIPTARIAGTDIELVVTFDKANFKDVDTYVFTATDLTGNYVLSNNILPVTVSPKEVSVNWEVLVYTYTGLQLDEPKAYILDTNNNKVYLTLTHDKVEFKNAGTYVFTAALSDENYVLANAMCDVVIEKAVFNMDSVSWNYTAPIVFSGSEVILELTGLPSGLKANYSGEKATNVGKYKAQVTFVYDTENYEEVTFEAREWEIIPLAVSVTWNKEVSYMYNGKYFNLPTATFNNVLNQSVALSVVEKDTKAFMNAGDYTFTASIIDELDRNNYVLDETKVTTATVAKNNQLSLDSLTATYGDTLSTVTVPSSEFGIWTFVDPLTTTVGNAGDNTFDVVFTPENDNYDVIETTVIIKVSKKLLTINVDKNTFTYDGISKELEVSVDGLINGDTVDILGNISKINVSTTQTTLSIEDENYYAVSVVATLVIEKAAASIKDNLTAKVSDYNASVLDLSSYFEVLEGESSIVVSVTQNDRVVSLKNAGVYDVVVSMAESANYNATSITFTYTINKISPSLEYKGITEFTYNANVITLEVSSSNTDGTKVALAYELYNEETELFESISEIKVAGTYKVYATINESTNFISDAIEFAIVVDKGSINVEELDSITATYGQQLSEFEFGVVAGGHWEWSDKDAYVGNVGETNVHKAIFIPNDASIESKEQDVTFIVNPKTITFTLGTLVFDYDGTEKEVIYALSETPEGVTVVVDGTIKALDYVEGGYTFTLTIAGNDNYTGSISGVFVINQIDASYVVPTFTATYNDTYQDVVYIKENVGTEGTWSILGDLSTSVGNAGSNNITVVFTPDSNNFKSVTLTTTLQVAKADLTPSSLPGLLSATFGDNLGKVDLSSYNVEGTWNFTSGLSTLVGNAGTNTFEIKFVHSNVNYNDYVTTVDIEVAKASSVITNKLPNKLVYTGEELIKKYFELNHSEASLKFVVIKDGQEASVINAGTYTVVVSVIDTDNYNGTSSDEITVVVDKATPVTDFTNVFNVFWNSKLGGITLNPGYTWADENTVLSTVKEGQQFPAIYTPNDTENYEVINGAFTVNVKKIVGTINAVDQTFDYDPTNTLGFTLIVSSNNTDGVEVTYTVLGLDDNKIVNAGTYTVTFSSEESDHYTAATKEIIVTVNKRIEEVIAVKEVAYGSTIEDVTVTASEYGTFTVTKEDPRLLQAVSSDSFLGNADSDITLYVTFVPYADYADNFETFVKEITVSIVKKELTFTDVESVYTYDTTEKTVLYTLNGMVNNELTSDITVEGNVVITNVLDSTKVKLTVVHKNYYGEIEVDLVINKANPQTDFTTIYQVEWNKTLADIQLNAGYSFTTTNLALSVGEIGEHTLEAKYTPTDIDNYNVVYANITYNVNKAVSSIIVSNYDLTYAPNTTYTIDAYASHDEEAKITITYLYNNKTVDYMSVAGEYKVTIVLEESDHYQDATKVIDITVKQATPSTNFTTIYEVLWVEGLVLGDIKLADGYTWFNENIALKDVEEKEYAAIFTPEDTVNYATIDGKFMVKVLAVDSVITVEDNQVFTYGDTIDLGVSLNHNEVEQLTYTYSYAAINSEEFTTVDAITNAGTYKVTISVADSDHFNASSVEIIVTVNQVTVEWTESKIYAAIYGDKLSDLKLPTSEFGTWGWELEEDTTVGKASAKPHTFVVVFTPYKQYSANYTANPVEVSVTVAQAESKVTETIPENMVYGNVGDYNTWFELNHKEATMNIVVYFSGVEDPVQSISNAGSYTIVIEVAETENYTSFYREYPVTVAQAQYTGEITKPTVEGAVYGDLLSNTPLIGGNSDGTWSWANPNDTVGDATTTGNSRGVIFTINDNYIPVTTTVTILVAKRAVDITITGNTYDYNGSTQYITYTLGNVLDGDTVTLTGNTGLLNASSQSFTLTVDNPNYSGSVTTTLTINQLTPTITWPVYEGTFYEDRLTTSSNYTTAPAADIDGTFTYSSAIYGDETVLVTFTPTDAVNYKTLSENVSITIAPIAHIGDVKYGTIEKAVAAAVENDVIYVYVGTNPYIKKNITIGSKVTLVIPHTDDTRNPEKAELTGSSYTNFATAKSANLKNTVKLNKNVVITNYGTIEISGKLSGSKGNAKAAGQTAGAYARLLMYTGSKIENYGSILCYGYIYENSVGKSSINSYDGSEIWMPFILRDYYGGSIMYGINSANKKMSAFNVFQFVNIHCKITFKYGSQLNGWANLYADKSVHKSEVKFIGKTVDGKNNAFINMNDSEHSYVVFDYDKDTADDFDDIQIYGGAEFGSLEIKVSAGLISKTMSTKDVYFPLSCKLHISLNKHKDQTTALYKMPDRYKMMPGHVFRVEAGAELEAGEITVYEEYIDTTHNEDGELTAAKYPTGLPMAQFVVNGKLKATHLAGYVHTEATSGAQIEVTGNTIMTTYEPGLVAGDGMGASVDNATLQTLTNRLSLQMNGTDGKPSEEFIYQEKGTFIASNKGWYRTNITVYYDGNGGQIVGDTYNTQENTNFAGYTIYRANITDPTREHYTFEGWYLDSACTQSAEGVTVLSNTKIYAKWQAIDYDIVVENIGSNESVTPGETTYTGPYQFNIESNLSLDTKPTNGSYEFAGWFLDSACTIGIDKIIGSELIAAKYLNEDNKLVLYAKWMPAGTRVYTVEFDANSGTGEMNSVKYSVGTQEQLPASLFAKTGYLFSGWALTADGDVVYADSASVLDLSTENGAVVTLYAKWTPIKYYIIFDSNNGSGEKTRQEFTYDVEQTLTANGFTNSDKTFDGWKYNNTTYSDQQSVKNLTTTNGAELTFTAQWKTSGGGGCFASGTMILMADGTMKSIDDIVLGDRVLVMNHLTGQLDVSVIMMNVHENQESAYYDTLTLQFSNGKTLTIVYNHGLYDVTLGKYVQISLSNYHEFIGHEFYYVDPTDYNSTTTVTLLDGQIETKLCKVYGPFSYEHLNLFAEGFLTVSGEIVDLYNCFEFDENAAYDIEKMEADIEKYGLYTYEDLQDYVTEQEFDGFNTKYFKVAVGKGLLTYEQILGYISKYLRNEK